MPRTEKQTIYSVRRILGAVASIPLFAVWAVLGAAMIVIAFAGLAVALMFSALLWAFWLVNKIAVTIRKAGQYCLGKKDKTETAKICLKENDDNTDDKEATKKENKTLAEWTAILLYAAKRSISAFTPLSEEEKARKQKKAKLIEKLMALNEQDTKKNTSMSGVHVTVEYDESSEIEEDPEENADDEPDTEKDQHDDETKNGTDLEQEGTEPEDVWSESSEEFTPLSPAYSGKDVKRVFNRTKKEK